MRRSVLVVVAFILVLLIVPVVVGLASDADAPTPVIVGSHGQPFRLDGFLNDGIDRWGRGVAYVAKVEESRQRAVAEAARRAEAVRQAARAARAARARRPVVVAASAAPAASVYVASGSDVWSRLRNCESGGNYRAATGNGFYGAYQFTLSTWSSIGGAQAIDTNGDGRPDTSFTNPAQAPPWWQDAMARHNAQVSDPYHQWPRCWPRAVGGR